MEVPLEHYHSSHVDQSSKEAIPSHLHHEYLALTHQTTVRDALEEPDEDGEKQAKEDDIILEKKLKCQ